MSSAIQTSKDKAKELHSKGFTDISIARMLNVSRQRIHQLLSELGLKSHRFNVSISRKFLKEMQAKYDVPVTKIREVIKNVIEKTGSNKNIKNIVEEKLTKLQKQKDPALISTTKRKQLIAKAKNEEEAIFIARQIEMVRYIRRKARNLGYKSDITLYNIEWPKKCPVFNTKLNYSCEKSHVDNQATFVDNQATFDKVNPKKRYMAKNVRIISYRANRIKDNGTAKEHFEIATYIKENW